MELDDVGKVLGYSMYILLLLCTAACMRGREGRLEYFQG